MNVTQILSLVRTKLDDERIPYLWKDEELIQYLIQVVDEWHRDVLPVRDSSTPEVTIIPILSGTHTYSLHPSILEIVSIYLSSNKKNIWPIDEETLNISLGSWRTLTGTPSLYIPEYESAKIRVVPYYDKTGYIEAEASFSGNTITLPSGKIVSSDWSVGDELSVNGTDENDGIYLITNITNTTFTVSATLTDESQTCLIRKVRDKMYMTVNRLMVTPLSLEFPNRSPEIRQEHHIHLIDGILREAYKKADTETYDPNRSERHAINFEIAKAKAKEQKLLLRNTGGIFTPHPGAI